MVMNPQGAALCTSLWPTRTDIVDTISLRIALASTTITQLPAITSSGYDGFRARLAARLFGRQAEDIRIEAVRLESGVATIFVEVAAESGGLRLPRERATRAAQRERYDDTTE